MCLGYCMLFALGSPSSVFAEEQEGGVARVRVDTEPQLIPYSRALYRFRSYKPARQEGFYTGQRCGVVVDHVVSLKDAHSSGAAYWSPAQRRIFANDKKNHVAACRRVNASKGAAVPVDFFRRSRDGKGLDYSIHNPCEYLEIYFAVKTKYELSFAHNDPQVFSSCGLKIGRIRTPDSQEEGD